MVKSSCLAKLPKEQRCHFLIGPISSWFMPSATDIWTQPKCMKFKSSENSLKVSQDDTMDCDQLDCEENASLSYFIYGSIGCFCYGQIHHHLKQDQGSNDQHFRPQFDSSNLISAFVDCLIDVKEDNSRVSCARFLKTSLYPIAMILTESGTLLIHDCLSNDNLVHFKKSELITKFVETVIRHEDTNSEHCNKKPRFNVTQQVNSCLWPNAKNAFLGISLLKEKTNLLVWLKFKDLTRMRRNNSQSITKTDLIDSHEKLELNLPQYSSPICCMESVLLDSKTCLIAIAMDDGLITVINVNFDQGQTKRVIKLARHNDQICSMSFFVENTKKFPQGLLATASRNGLLLIWDIENEFYFADYQASPDGGRINSRINWFSLSFIPLKDSKHINLAISNSDSGLTILELPENVRSKIRLKENKDKQKKQNGEQTLRHHALIFNIVFDSITETIMTSSLDGNHILWNCQQQELTSKNGKKEGHLVEVKPQYLFPSMQNNSRTHMLRHSPIKEDLLGMALGKAGVRFYKVAESSINHRFDMSFSSGLIARKIIKASLSPTSLSWHPSHEYRVAIGTLEGKVFRADLTPRRAALVEAEHKCVIKSRLPEKTEPKLPIQPDVDIFDVEYQPLERQEDFNYETCSSTADSASEQHLKTDGVYSLCWGPNPTCPQDISRLAIYAIGSISHRLFIYHNKKENSDKLINYFDESLDQSLPEAFGEASEVAWKSSMDLMALGTTTGKIIIVGYHDESNNKQNSNNLFRKFAVIQGHLGTTYIQCLAWHPTADKDNPYYYCIAASANESSAFVFSIKENMFVEDVKARLRIEEGVNDQYVDAETNIISTYVYKLDAHKKAISDIGWNPHEPNQLATSSFDRYCYVWSLDESATPNARIISKFSARDRLFTLEWSLVDTDLIFTSGHDSTIWAWRPSENHLKNELP